MLSQVIKGYLYKYSHLTLFKMGFFILVVVSLFFTYQNIQVINALHSGAANSVNIDPNVIETPYRTVRDAILSSPYQATVLFLPILSALIIATDYQFGEDEFSSLICANWKIRLFSQIFSIIAISITTTFTLFLLNALLLKFMLVSKLQSILSIGLMLDVFTRIVAFTITALEAPQPTKATFSTLCFATMSATMDLTFARSMLYIMQSSKLFFFLF